MPGSLFPHTAGYADGSYPQPPSSAHKSTLGDHWCCKAQARAGDSQRYTGSRLSMSQSATISNDPPRSYPQLVAAYGFLPNLFRAQIAIPRAIEAQQGLIDTVVVRQGRLSRDQKDAILNGVATVRTGVGLMLCTLADGLRPRLDAELRSPAPSELLNVPEPLDWPNTPGPHLGLPSDSDADSRAYGVLREQFGFVPNLYRLQN